MNRFDPRKHFVFKGKVYDRRKGNLMGGQPVHGVKAPEVSEEPEGVLKIIHVNRHHIAANRKDGGTRPCYTVKVAGRKKTIYARSVVINGPSECVADDDQLTCGARVWIETKAQLWYLDPMDYEQAKRQFPDAVMEE